MRSLSGPVSEETNLGHIDDTLSGGYQVVFIGFYHKRALVDHHAMLQLFSKLTALAL